MNASEQHANPQKFSSAARVIDYSRLKAAEVHLGYVRCH